MDNGFKPQPENFEANNYNNTTGQSLSTKEIKTIEQGEEDLKSNIIYNGADSILVRGSIQSKNFRSGTQGFRVKSNGDAEINSGTFVAKQAATSTNYYKVLTDATTGISLWVGNGTTANGNLSGTAGDVLLNGGSNKPEYCTGTTTWVALV